MAAMTHVWRSQDDFMELSPLPFLCVMRISVRGIFMFVLQ